jgi:hypothetical protein
MVPPPSLRGYYLKQSGRLYMPDCFTPLPMAALLQLPIPISGKTAWPEPPVAPVSALIMTRGRNLISTLFFQQHTTHYFIIWFCAFTVPERLDFHNRRSATCGQKHPQQLCLKGWILMIQSCFLNGK